MPNIQNVAFPEYLATFDDDYALSVVHLVWALKRHTPNRILMCGAVELLPHEVPAPIPRPERSTTISNNYFIYTQEVVVSARRGLKWFEDTSRGIAVRPNKQSFDDFGPFNEVPRFDVGPFAEEPPAKALLATDSAPFSADWHGWVRTKRLISNPGPFVGWTTQEQTRATDWIRDECHVDLAQSPEYVGSVHLIATNPVFRSIVVRDDRAAPGRFGLFVAFKPRSGKSVEGLELVVEEKRTTGIGILAHAKIEGPLLRVDLPYFPAQVRELVVDPRRGPLHESPFGVFGVGFNMSVELATTVRRIDPGMDDKPYEVAIVGGNRTTTEVPPVHPIQEAETLLVLASQERARKQRGAAQQRWFKDQAPNAVKALRDLVGPAKGVVFVCDPYFGARDLLRVVMAIANPSTAVQILTSAKHLKKDSDAEANALEAQLAQVQVTPQTSPIHVRVMCGADPAIHDRFIVLKEAMWMLGSSINHFGQRGTLMIAVPDPQPVREELEKVWDASPLFAEWMAARRASKLQ
jgi:hypothetical protein